ncbi:hypothetical protein NA56DRAFT_452889 [Hyaloscypha hepaticicola]|uniref:Uncharacterized protein n=1 Tax=Hyaloscypha hepaticicola TaxID=2082293 RepID=A0A2J6PFM6_9HELO|nr:hypothetical protein NA56DRAFT_452889 [Hyaloscypha hepaticicola]
MAEDLYPHVKLGHDGFGLRCMHVLKSPSQSKRSRSSSSPLSDEISPPYKHTINLCSVRGKSNNPNPSSSLALTRKKKCLSPAQSDRLRTYIVSPSFEPCRRTLTRLLPSTSLPSPELRARAHRAILLHLTAYDDSAREVPLDTLAGAVLDTWQACRDLDLGSDGDGGGKKERKQEEFAMVSETSIANRKAKGKAKEEEQDEFAMASGASIANRKEKGKAKEEQRLKGMEISQSLPLRVRHCGPPKHMSTTTTKMTTAIEGEHGMGVASIKLPQHWDNLTTSLPRREESGHILQSGGRLMRFVTACLGWIWSWNFILGPLMILIGPKFWIRFFLRLLPLCPNLLPVINSLASLIWNHSGIIMRFFGTLANAWWTYALESSVGSAP